MGNLDQPEEPTCFVAMPITTRSGYVEKFGDANHFPHVLEHLFSPALIKAGYRVIAPSSRGAQLIHAEIIKNLEQADLVLCDLSSLNVNVFFELGIRTSLDRPVVLVKDKGTERIPFDLNAINTHTYDESLTPWTLNNEIDMLAEHIKAVDTGAAAGNDMWHYFGLTKRATPAEIEGNLTEAKVDLLLTEMAALRERHVQDSTPIGVALPASVGYSSADIGEWFTRAMDAVMISPRLFAVTRPPGGYQIEVHGPLIDEEKKLLEEEALRELGIKVNIYSTTPYR
jgi:hypothetical protein